MLKKIAYSTLIATLVLAGYLNFSTLVNAAPVIVADDAYIAYQGNNVTFSPHPFDNDNDPLGNIYGTNIDLDPATPGIQSNMVYPGFGTAFSTYNYDIQFTPEPGFTGTSTIQYTTHNLDGESNIGTITIEYYPDVVPIANNDSYTIAEGGSLPFYPLSNDDAVGGSLNDATLDLDVFSPGVQSSTTTPAGFFETISGELRTTATTTAGTYILQYTVDDNAGTSNIADIEFNVIVNAPPVALADIRLTPINQGATDLVPNVTGNDSDPEGYIFTYGDLLLDPASNFYVPSYANSEGNWTDFCCSNDVFYVNNGSFSGTTTFQYRVKDQYGNISNFANIEIPVVATPPVAGDDFVSGVDGQLININYYVNDDWFFLTNYDNVDFDPLTPGFQTSTTTPIGTFSHQFGATSVQFQTITGVTGVAETPYQIFNQYGLASNVATITVTVNPNTLPVASDFTYPNTPLYPGEIAGIDPGLLGFDGDFYFFGVNDFDIDLLTPGFQQTLSGVNGSWITPDSGLVRFQTGSTSLGSFLFPFQLKDNANAISNTATITINVVNDDPTAGDDFASTATNLAIEINILQNDDPLGGTIAAIDLYPDTIGTNETSTSTSEGTWTVQGDNEVLFIPTPLFTGLANLQYVIEDSFGARSLPATIQVDVSSRPFLKVHHGAVAKSTSTMVFDPTNIPAVSSIGSSCPRIPLVNSNMLATESFKSDVRNVQLNGEYTGMFIIENVGDQPAYDVMAQLQQDSYLDVPVGGRNLCVTKGDGTVLVSGLDYFGEFMFQDMPSSSLGAYDPINAGNIIVITYDVRWPFAKDQEHQGYVTNYAALDGGPNLAFGFVQDNFTAFVKTLGLTLNNLIPNPALAISGLTIGQRIDYQVEIDIPEMSSSTLGSSSSTILKVILPEGMVIFDDNTGNFDNNITVSVGSLTNTSTYFQFDSNGNLEFVLDNYENNNPFIDTIQITVPAVVLDTATNTASTGVTFVNTVQMIDRFNNETTSDIVLGVATSSTKLLQEPALVLRNLSATSTNASGTIQYLFELFQEDGLSDRADAFEVEFYFQTNGPGLTPLTITNPITGGLPAATTTIGSLYLAWPTIAGAYTSSSPITISFTGTITPTTSTTSLSYPVGLSFSSLPGLISGPLSSFSALSHERSYVGTTTHAATYVFSGVVATPTPPCVGSCVGGGGVLGCMDPKASNYNQWATQSDGSCVYPVVSPTSTTPVITSTSTPTSTAPLLPPEYTPTACQPFITSNIEFGRRNNPEDVRRLQTFLNRVQGEVLIVDGEYKLVDVNAVKRFQSNNPEVLRFWNLNKPTGSVFITTRKRINTIQCEYETGIKCPFFTQYQIIGDVDPEVLRIKKFLNALEGEKLTLSENFDAATDLAVKRFQARYTPRVLVPWGLRGPTGWWYQSTKKTANDLLGCFEPVRLDNGVVIE